MNINKTIKDIFKRSKNRIDSVIFVGGFCSNDILIYLIKKDLEKTIHIFLQPSKPCLAIMEEAVLFGISPNIISSRIVRYTIGINVRLPWMKKNIPKIEEKYLMKLIKNGLEKIVLVNI